jgi:NAD+ kinase
MKRVAIIGSPEKPLAADTLARARDWLSGRADVVFAEITYESHRALPHKPDVLFVLGGDGTMLAAVRNLGRDQLPIVGVNLGKLGFLAEFTIEQLEREGQFLFESNELPLTHRLMLHVRFESADKLRSCESLAVNDCVVFAGPPFRMIELTVEIDGVQVAEIRGDGLIVSTASGSTAHNLSAGGPILEPDAQSILLTPICPHALTFRPLALSADRTIVVRVARANDGTTLTIDGHAARPFRPGDRLQMSRHPASFMLVRNPRRSMWYSLRRKLMWGQSPNNGNL